jgi:hypothetical protein
MTPPSTRSWMVSPARAPKTSAKSVTPPRRRIWSCSANIEEIIGQGGDAIRYAVPDTSQFPSPAIRSAVRGLPVRQVRADLLSLRSPA